MCVCVSLFKTSCNEYWVLRRKWVAVRGGNVWHYWLLVLILFQKPSWWFGPPLQRKIVIQLIPTENSTARVISIFLLTPFGGLVRPPFSFNLCGHVSTHCWGLALGTKTYNNQHFRKHYKCRSHGKWNPKPKLDHFQPFGCW